RDNQRNDALYRKVIASPDDHKGFILRDDLLWRQENDHDVICVPKDARIGQRRAIEIIISDAHKVLGHLGRERTAKYIRSSYWWP
ncbi:hypothetical protein SISNIDRAFT_384167, partial [Sistotremastrum niveocremeum HHB9708]